MMKPKIVVPAMIFLSIGCNPTAHAEFSISIAGKNVNLANPGELNSGNKIANVDNKKNNQNPAPLEVHNFDINMSKPLTTESDVKKQAEKSCVVLGMNNPKHEDENIIRVKCHMLNMESPSPPPELRPLLNNMNEKESSKKYKPHFEIGEIKVKETKSSIEDPNKKHQSEKTIDTQTLNGDRSCDITKDLRVMLSPKCLRKSETKAEQNIGEESYKESFNDGKNISKEITEEQDDDAPKYLCHIDFKEKAHHGFVQGYISSPSQCIHSATILHGVKKAEVFDHMGYLIKRYLNKRN